MDFSARYFVAKASAELKMGALGARLRRHLTRVLFWERMGVSRDTLHRLEKGDPGISLGMYLRALRVLGLDTDVDLLALGDSSPNRA